MSFSSSNEEEEVEDREVDEDLDSTMKMGNVAQEEEAKLRRIERILYNKRSSAWKQCIYFLNKFLY